MALFKILKGNKNNLPTNKVDGYCYVTLDEHKLYVDYKKTDNTLDRFALNAVTADKLGTDAGNVNTPVYFEDGIPKAVSYNLSSMQSGIDNAIVGLSVSGTTVTYTRQNGDSGTITTQNTDTKVTQNAATTSDRAYPIILGYNSSTSKVTNVVNKAASFTYNPSTKRLNVPGTVIATTFSGALSGNAATATYATSAGAASTAEAFTAAKSITLSGDITGTSSSTEEWAISTTLASTGVSAGSYGLASAATPAFGSSFNVPYITVDTKGRITSASTYTVKLPANPDTGATSVAFSGSGNALTNVSYNASNRTLTFTKATYNNYTLPLATNSVRGGVKIGYSQNGKNYPVQLSNEQMFVNVPWTNSTYTSLPNPKALTIGSQTYTGSSAITITAADLGVTGAMVYKGTTSTEITDGGTQAPTINNASIATSSLQAGNVVLYGAKEFVWNGSKWELLGDEGSYKVKQTAVASPSASGNTTSFIDTISQDTNGNITATKKTVSTVTQSAAGLMSAEDKKKLDGIAAGATANTGDITGVTAGNGLTGGGSSGSVTLNVGAGAGLTVSADSIGHTNSVTASTAKGSDTKTLTFGGTFALPTVSYDAQGHVTGSGTTTMTMPSDRLFVTLVPTGTSIPANANLNTPTYMKVGRYYCSKTANAATLTNCPVNVAFMMEVYSPLSTTIDDETTGTWVYRIRKITVYNTGMQFIQYASVGATANVWTYGDWKVQPIANFALDTADSNGGSAITGSATKPIYINSSGQFTACTHTLNATVPSDAKFTDTTYSIATSSVAGLMSAADKAKLDGIASGATANTGDITGVTAGSGLTGGGSSGSVTLNIGAGTGISVTDNAVALATSGVTAGTYGPSAAVTGSNNATMNVPEITVDAYGRVTKVTNRVYTAKNNTYTSLKNPNAITIQGNGTTLTDGVYDGSAAKTVNITPSAIGAAPSSHTHDDRYYTESETNTKLNTKLDKLTYEWNKEYNAGGTAGYLLIGSFPMYDTNVTIDIDATTSTTYHGTVVIATQNVSTTSIGSAHTITVYGDPTGAISNAIRVIWASGSRNYNVYFVPATWSKNLIHIRAIGQHMDTIDTTKICTQFTTGTAPTTTSGLTVVNALTSNFNKFTYTHPTTSGNKHIPAGGSSGQILRWSADGTATWGSDNNTTYSAGTGISLSGTTFSNSGVRSIATGSANGTISVNTNGNTANVAVKGLGTAAYKNIEAFADKAEGVFFIEGSGTTNETDKISTWTGESDRITEYYDGLTIRYKIGVKGQNTVKLNINNLGAKTVYRFNTTKLTTHFSVGSIITLIYHADLNDGCWITNDYDSNTNTQQRVYETSSDKEYAITTRYDTTDGATYYAEYGRYTNGVTLNPAKNTITASTFKGDLSGTATKVSKDLTIGSKTYNGSSAVSISASDLGLAQALKFVSSVSSLPSTTSGYSIGDVILVGNKEYVCTASNTWTELGDGSSYAFKTTTITGTNGLTGGGALSTNQTISANLVSNTKLSNAASAATETAGRVYPVAMDKNGKLAVNVPWSNTDSKVAQVSTVANANYHLLFANSSSIGTSTAAAVQKNANLYYNPSTQTLNTTKLSFSNAVTLSYNSADKSLDFIFA